MKKYSAPKLRILLMGSPNVMLEMSDENSLFVDILDKADEE